MDCDDSVNCNLHGYLLFSVLSCFPRDYSYYNQFWAYPTIVKLYLTRQQVHYGWQNRIFGAYLVYCSKISCQNDPPKDNFAQRLFLNQNNYQKVFADFWQRKLQVQWSVTIQKTHYCTFRMSLSRLELMKKQKQTSCTLQKNE